LANTASAIKRVRSNARKAARNKIIRGRARSSVRQARTALSADDLDAAKTATLAAIGELDNAASKGVIHKNNASRRKGRLMKRLAAFESKK
jgi:small subunit ribosomal protein S20